MIITAENLRKTYKTYKKAAGLRREAVYIDALDGVSFEIEDGTICGLLGPNGAGKSTAVKIMCGAIYPTGGKLDIMGYNPAKDRKKYVSKIGAVFGQKSQLIWDIPPIDSFKMNRAIYGIDKKDYQAVLDELIEILEVDAILDKPTRVLSLGERMKCEFIMSMLHRPKIVFLDEPTIGLDVIAKAAVREFIKKLNNKGITFILTTHDLEDVEQLAEQIIIINHGKKVFDDSLVNLRRKLGQRKIIDLILNKPPAIGALDNLAVVNRPSNLELTVEANTSDISGFIETLIRRLDIRDISVKEPPMEDIITTLYQQ